MKEDSTKEIYDCDVIPSWLNKEFLENSLRKGLKLENKRKNFKIINASIESATGKGENYASQMFRCRLTTTYDDVNDDVAVDENLNVVVKSLPGSDGKEHLENFMFFEKEIKMLTETLPMMNDILVKGYPHDTKFGARCYYHDQTPFNHFLIMEDLKEKNFKNADRITGLDMNHVELVLKTLAKFHVASLSLPPNVSSTKIYRNSFYSNKNINFVREFVGAPFDVLSNDVINWTNENGDGGEKTRGYSEKLKNLKKNVVEDFLNLLTDDDDNFKLKVLNHGDPWVNNIMFKYDDDDDTTGSGKKPIDIMFVDFQLVSFNSPMVDLHYFIFTSIRNDLKFERIEQFLKIYHKYFSQAVDKLKIKDHVSYDYVTMKKEFESLYLWGMVVICVVYPHMCVEKENALTLDEILKGNKGKLLTLYKNESLRKTLLRAFDFFHEKGVF